MTQLLTHLFAGGIIGSYFVSSLWGPYSLAVKDDVSSNIRMAGSVITGLGWGLYVSLKIITIVHKENPTSMHATLPPYHNN